MSRLASDFKRLFQSIKDPALRAEIFKELKDNFLDIVSAKHDLFPVCLWLSNEERDEIYQLYKNNYFPPIKTIDEMDQVIYAFNLSNKQAEALYVELKKSYVIEVLTIDDYKILLRYIKSPALRVDILNELHNNFEMLYQSRHHVWEQCCLWLSKEEKLALYNQKKDTIIPKIITVDGMINVISAFELPNEQAKEFYFALKKSLPEPGFSVDNYNKLFRYIKDPVVRAEIFKEVNDNFLNLVKTMHDVFTLTLWLTEEERDEIYHQYKSFAPIYSIKQMDEVIRSFNLSNQQAEALYVELQESHPVKKFRKGDYQILLRFINDPTLRADIVKKLNDNFLDLVDSMDAIWSLCLWLSDKESAEVYLRYKEEFFEEASTIQHLAEIIYAFHLSPKLAQELHADLQRKNSEVVADGVNEQQKPSPQFNKPDPEKPSPVASNKFHQEFNEKIKLLQQKMAQFAGKPEFEKAYNAAQTLYGQLEAEGNGYFTKKPSSESYKIFRQNCEGFIKTARIDLDMHRGDAKIVANVLAIIVSVLFTAGLGYALAAGVNMLMNKGKFTLFSTDSSIKINEIEDCINTAGPASAA